MKKSILAVCLVLLTFCKSAHSSPNEFKTVSSGVKYHQIGEYSVERLNTILTTEVEKFARSP